MTGTTNPAIRRGMVCWATVPSGFGHDQGTRPWVVLSMPGPERAIAVPVSTEPPNFGYPLSWPVPQRWGLDHPSWLRIDHVRSLPSGRLRDPFAAASRDDLLDIFDALGELLDASITPR